MRKTKYPTIVASLLIGAALSEQQQPWRDRSEVLLVRAASGTPPSATPALWFPSSRSFLLTASAASPASIASPYFRDEDFVILDDDIDVDQNGSQDEFALSTTSSIRRGSSERGPLFFQEISRINNKSRPVRRAIASALSGILASAMSARTNSRNDVVVPILAAVALLASTVFVKTAIGGLATTARSRQESSSKEVVGSDAMDESDTVQTSASSDEDESVATQELAPLDSGANDHNIVVEQAPDEILFAAKTPTENVGQLPELVISKEQYDVLSDEATKLKTQLLATESRLEELQQELRQYEHLQREHDIELQEAVQRERKQAQDLVQTMQRAMVSVMRKERDDLVTDFQRQAAFLRETLLSEDS